jgi:vacuolar-type H+-ATPase catalytic subunit A/Vma1
MIFTIDQLQQALQDVSSSQHPDKSHLMRALQNQIAQAYLHQSGLMTMAVLDDLIDQSLLFQLSSFPYQQLDAWLTAFLNVNLTPPRELWEARELKNQLEGKAYLKKLIDDFYKTPTNNKK